MNSEKRIKTVLHEFGMGDVEDPILYAADPIWKWQQTEQGQWCMSHGGVDPSFICIPAPDQWGYRVVIYGDLSPVDHTYFQLKWGNKDDNTN
jgi:hypothetical protein